MEVPVTCHGEPTYTVLVNVTPAEHCMILGKRWCKLRGRPVARGAGDLFNLVAELRKQNENFFPNLLPVEHRGRVVTYARVDPDDGPDLARHRWVLTREGYAHFWNPLMKRHITMHRYVMDFPEGLVVDHVTWNRLDNRKGTLRTCTQADNARNGTRGWLFGKKLFNNCFLPDKADP
jgi:hypothetical protein